MKRLFFFRFFLSGTRADDGVYHGSFYRTPIEQVHM